MSRDVADGSAAGWKSRCTRLEPVIPQGPFPPGRTLGWFPWETLSKLFVPGESNVSWSVS